MRQVYRYAKNDQRLHAAMCHRSTLLYRDGGSLRYYLRPTYDPQQFVGKVERYVHTK